MEVSEVSELRMLRGRVLLEQVRHSQTTLIVPSRERLGSWGKNIEKQAGELDAGHVRMNVGFVLSVHPDDEAEYGVKRGMHVLFPQHSGAHFSWDEWERSALLADRRGRPRPPKPQAYRLSLSDAHALWELFGRRRMVQRARDGVEVEEEDGIVLVVSIQKIMIELPDGEPLPGQVA